MLSRKAALAMVLASIPMLVSFDASAERRKRQRNVDATEGRADGDAPAEDDAEPREGATSERDDWTPYALRDDVALDARWWSATRFGSTFDFALRGQGMVAPNVAIGFTLPWTFNVREVGDPIAALGNPTLDVHYAARVGIVTWHAGGGISAPLASIQDESGAYRIATVVGATTLASYDLHLYVPTFLPLRAFGGVEVRPNHVVSIRGGLSPLFFIPIEGGDFELGLQEYVDVIALADVGFGGGLRLQGAHALTDDGDQAQMSIEPYLAYDDRQSFFTSLGLLMALDEQAGFAFDTGKVATLHFAIGGYLDGSGGDSF